MKTVSLIVSRCNVAGTAAFDRVYEKSYPTLRAAMKDAGKHARKGLSVLVRPNYNERTLLGCIFFREWRSFNGEPLKEVRFYPFGQRGYGYRIRSFFRSLVAA